MASRLIQHTPIGGVCCIVFLNKGDQGDQTSRVDAALFNTTALSVVLLRTLFLFITACRIFLDIRVCTKIKYEDLIKVPVSFLRNPYRRILYTGLMACKEIAERKYASDSEDYWISLVS